MTVTKASLQALEASATTRRTKADAQIAAAIKRMRKRGAAINISTVAREAGVSRSVIHRRVELREQISKYQPVTVVLDDPPPSSPIDSESSIVAALRTRLTARETQINDLKKQLRDRDNVIATLHGELARLRS